MLLAERISIRDMPTILEAVQEACANSAKSVGLIVAHVRTRLARQISESLIGAGGYIPVIVLSPEWEDTLGNSLWSDRRRIDSLHWGRKSCANSSTGSGPWSTPAVQGGEKPAIMTSMQVA